MNKTIMKRGVPVAMISALTPLEPHPTQVRVQPVILSGGFGARLWPLSRETLPKQFLRLTGERSLLQATLARLTEMAVIAPGLALETPVIVSNVAHRSLIDEQLEGVSAEIIAEPVSRNTAPALTLAALTAVARGQGDCVLVVSPSDHHVVDISAFAQILVAAATLAERGSVVTIGITPTRPETGYGYIHLGARRTEYVTGSTSMCVAFPVVQFTEKPDATTAAGFLATGEYLWNSGVFILRASRWLELIGQFAPQIERACRTALDGGRVMAGSSPSVRTVLPDPEAFAQSPSDSIDYAVMEKAVAHGVDVVVLPFTAGWSDVGDFSALAEVNALDADRNIVHGEVVTVDTTNSVLIAQQRLVAVLGMSDVVVVETGDTVLVTHRSRSQELRRMVQALKDRDRPETVNPPMATATHQNI